MSACRLPPALAPGACHPVCPQVSAEQSLLQSAVSSWGSQGGWRPLCSDPPGSPASPRPEEVLVEV